MNLTDLDIAAFASRVEKTDTCWLWTGGVKSPGYGNFQIGRGTLSRSQRPTKLAHRVSWEIYNEIIPDGLLVCHSCDNPSCVRPSHLFLGTVKDNALDMVRKRRTPMGENQHASIFKEEEVLILRKLFKKGWSITELHKYISKKAGKRAIRRVVREERRKTVLLTAEQTHEVEKEISYVTRIRDEHGRVCEHGLGFRASMARPRDTA